MTDDELDIQVRGAMKVLDGEVPSGYFDGLPTRTLARLEDRSMDTTPSTGPQKSDSLPPPIAAESAAPKKAEPRDEDSGLHDIRSLAQSTKQRLSKKSTAQPPIDEDILASSSAGWKNVALPEPAKMISLPALEQLPSKKQIKEQIKAQKEKAAAPVAARPPTHLDESPLAPKRERDSAPGAAKAAPAASMSFGANIAKKPSSKAPLYAVIGVGLAAAAGGLIYVATQGGSKSAPVVAKADETPRAPVVAPAPPPPAVAAVATPPVETTAPSGSAAVETPPPVEIAATTPVSPKSVGKSVAKPGKLKVESKPSDAKPEVPSKKPESKSVGKEPPKEGEPDFNDLLKEAGVKDPTKAKAKLDKKSLSGGDFKAGMNSIAGKASACYAGTQGTAIVKLTIAPSGAVSKASVSGPFAGTAVAACVEAAVRGASFPAWEGGPQSFGYSFLLSE